MTYREETGKDAYSGEAKTLLAFSRTSLGMKLRQFASGFVYTDDEHKTYVTTHREKIEALKELVEGFDGGILVAYQFKSEYEELKKPFRRPGGSKPTRMLYRGTRGVCRWHSSTLRA